MLARTLARSRTLTLELDRDRTFDRTLLRESWLVRELALRESREVDALEDRSPFWLERLALPDLLSPPMLLAAFPPDFSLCACAGELCQEPSNSADPAIMDAANSAAGPFLNMDVSLGPWG